MACPLPSPAVGRDPICENPPVLCGVMLFDPVDAPAEDAEAPMPL